jgi:hypothetical protein
LISKTKPRSKLCSAFVSILLTLLLRRAHAGHTRVWSPRPSGGFA